MKTVNAIFSALFLALTIVFQLYAQETSTSTASEAERKLDEQLRIREKEKLLAELDKEILEAQPKAKSTPVSAETTLSGESIEPDIMVYKALSNLADRVSAEVSRSVPQNAAILVLDPDYTDDLDFYRKSFPYIRLTIEDMIAGFEKFKARDKEDIEILEREKALPLPSAFVLPNITNIVGQAVDLLSYFRTQTSEKGANVKIEEEALIAETFNRLSARRDLLLFYPKKFSPETFTTCATISECSELLGLLDRLYAARRAAKVEKTTDNDLKKLDKLFTDFVEKLIDKEKDTLKRSPLERMANAEKLNSLIDRNDVYFLSMRSISAVGKQRVRKNLFFLSDKADYSGGIVLEWMLFDETGRVRNSGVLTEYNGYQGPNKIKGETPTRN